ncbi:MAG TPA: fimbrial assembly protein [Acidobacteriaceae bacterium]|jgi:type IV pilus assembly protein PilN|nr:fimbrial assembly protein [Acidobacteriaceae bacterium]
MRISVNLASHPYVELRPVYNRLRTWSLILVLVGLALWFLYHTERGQAEEARARVASVENRVQQLEQQQKTYQAMMQQPKDATILRQADFLNGLFRQKAFSWTATITDLETVLPSGVQVLSLDPIVAADGHVTIRLRVTGDRDRALDLVRNLEKSRHFASPRVASESLATQGTQGGAQNASTSNDVNFDILADYRPLPIEPTEKTEKEEKQPQAAAGKHAVNARRPRRPRADRQGGPKR